MKTRCQARLKIFGRGLGPDAIGAATGLRPDRTLHEGQVHVRPHATIIEKEDVWEIWSELPEEADIAAHIAAVLRKAEPHVDRIRALAATQTVLLACIVHSQSEPSLSFDSWMIQVLAQMGAGIDIDLYIGDEDF